MKKLSLVITLILISPIIFSNETVVEKYNFKTLDINQDGVLSEAEYNMSKTGMSESELQVRILRIPTESLEFSAFETPNAMESNLTTPIDDNKK